MMHSNSGKKTPSFLKKLSVPGTIVWFKLPSSVMSRFFGYRIFRAEPNSEAPPRYTPYHSNVHNLETGFAMVVGTGGPVAAPGGAAALKTGYVKVLIDERLFWVAIEHLEDVHDP